MKNFTGRKDEIGEYKAFLTKIKNGTTSLPCILNIYGGAGTGKSTLTRVLAEKYSQETGKFEHVFVDVSDCYDESKVLAKLAQAFKNQGIISKELAKFEILYHYCYGELSGLNKDTNREITTISSEFIIKHIKMSSDAATKTIDIMGTLSTLAPLMLNISKAASFIEIAFKIQEQYADYKNFSELQKILTDMAEEMSSEREIRIALRKYFIEGITKIINNVSEVKYIIFLDNFRAMVNSQIARDTSWLTSNCGLITNVSAFWIISGRDAFSCESISRIEMRLIGLPLEDGFDYINDKCEFGLNINLLREYQKYKTLKNQTEEIINKVSIADRILRICSSKHEGTVIGGTVENKGQYIPYKLNLATNHYIKLKNEDRSDQILPKDFARLENDEEFVGHYFYMDLTEQLLTAFQILSCIDTWNEAWLELIKTKFNNYLLNAHHLLASKTSVEKVGNGIIKLHEAIKDALYKSPDNKIKHDIQEFIFECFIKLYSDKDNVKSNSQIGTLAVYCELSLDYILFLKKEKMSFMERYDEFKKVFSNIYKYFNNAEIISYEFIAEFILLCDKIEKIFEVRDENGIIIRPGKHYAQYVEKLLELADLYTKMYNAKDAKDLEQKALDNAKQILEYEKELFAKYKTRNLINKCYNAFAYDSSLFWQYDDAAEYGLMGVREQYVLLKDFTDYLFDNSGDEALKVISSAYSDDIVVSSSEFPAYGTDNVLDYEALVKSLRNVFHKNKGSEEQKLLHNMIDTLDNLRGNLPWYYIRCQELGDVQRHMEIVQKFGNFAPVAYGIKTYLLRRAMHDATTDGIKAYSPKSLQSYHNIAVYFFKNKNLEKAYTIGAEACFRRIQTLERQDENNLNDLQKSRIKGLNKMLSDVNLPDYRSSILLEENPDSLESISYFGDYCLHLGFARRDEGLLYIAKEKLYQVFLTRYVRFGFNNSGTLDTYCRLAGVYYALDDATTAIKIIEKLIATVKEDGIRVPNRKLNNYLDIEKQMQGGTWNPATTL